ncbi:DNA gyrase subunit B [Telmatocola sphagniphila]|uniref:DNA topoisomerase (ATP-hydrolyzing) n=1 Tax=Telmatocola sphagniphila TaxID=1123043 RepID=A0A8E6B5E8_9BACT|nr:DNA gyrase subunit B [Telmatocola sphagniphila]QVL32217.1 DNA gyrase subunit B [Telmatocola sphagniphila]
METPAPAADYTHKNIQHLKDADHIRKRPDMYIPDTSVRGMHHLVYELVYNSVDEFLAGFCKHVTVTVHVDGSLSVGDDGRGIPVDMHPELKIPTLQAVMTLVGAGGKFDNNAYKVSAGLHGMGAKAVTALSELTKAEVRRDGRTYLQEFERGKPKVPGEVKDIGAADRTGTKITFWPDPEIFGDSQFNGDTLSDRLRELAFLNKSLHITFRDERVNREEIFFYEGGVAEYVAWMNRNEDALHLPIHIFKEVDNVKVEVALQYTVAGETEIVRCYANNQFNPNGGTHLSGFRAGLTRTLKDYGEREKLFKNDITPVGEDFREGMTAVINITLPNPQFEAQTKIRLNNPEVEGIVSSTVSEVLSKYLEENPKEAKKIIAKVNLAAEAREAEAKARRAVRERKNLLSGGGLPGKLLDCTSKDRDSSELFLVEGDSAGGSAEGGRDRMYQAVLPLRGKPLNVEKARFEHLLNNQEISSIIAAVGTDIGNPDDISKLRYGKIIILTDADIDGQHIRTLLLTFFFRQMRKLVEAGNIFVARPPLFKVEQKKQTRFIKTQVELQTELITRGLDKTRFKTVKGRSFEGTELKTLLDLLNRLEQPLQILERRGFSVNTLLPASRNGQLPLYLVKLGGRDHWFHTVEEIDVFRVDEGKKLGKELAVSDSDEKKPEDDKVHYLMEELHELRSANRTLEKLGELGFELADIVPPVQIAGREAVAKFSLEQNEDTYNIANLRDLVGEVRKFGEKGLKITRFKGLGEMDPQELWETTLDPSKRTLLRVTMTDAQKAHELFRTLMGEEVEKRRSYIFEKAINVSREEIDYGA